MSDSRPTANEDLLERTVAHAVLLERYKASVARRVVALLNDTEERLAEQLAARLQAIEDAGGYDAGREATERIAALLSEVRVLRAGAYAAIASTLQEEASSFAAYEARWQAALLEETLIVDVSIAAPTAEVLEAAVFSRPFAGALFETWVDGMEPADLARIERSIQAGVVEGRTTQQIVRDIVSGSGALEDSRRGAEAVARTALNHVATQAREEVYRANADLVREVRWVSTLDGRTTLLCASRDGHTFPVREGPRPPAHWRCLPGDARVLARHRITGATKRWFDGDVVILKTATGRELTCTPNHPVLTGRGWVPAEFIEFGCEVVCDGGREWEAGLDGDGQDVPARIQDVAESFLNSSEVLSGPVPVSAEDFHGDGGGSQVAVVGTNRHLGSSRDAALQKHGGETLLQQRGASGAVPLVGGGHLHLRLHGHLPAPDCRVGGGRECSTLVSGGPRHARQLLLTPPASLDASGPEYARNDAWADPVPVSNASDSDATAEERKGFFKRDGHSGRGSGRPQRFSLLTEDAEHDLGGNAEIVGDVRARLTSPVAKDDGSLIELVAVAANREAGPLDVLGDGTDADAVLACEILRGASGPVFLDEIVHIERRAFAGHVFNLETASGFYSANGVVTHNCRSTTVPVIDGVRLVGDRPTVRDTRDRRNREIDFRAEAKAKAGEAWDDMSEKQRGAAVKRIRERWARENIGSVPKTLSYEDWLRRQPTSFQDEVLGPSRGRLFRDGGLTLGSFTDASGKTLTLDQLRTAESAAFKKAQL